MNLTMRLAGEYQCVIKHADGTQTETGWMKNIITNGGLDMFGEHSTAPGTRCRVGTGSSTPTATQTALDAQVASTTNLTTNGVANEGSPTYATLYTQEYTFALGAVVANIAELGIGQTASGADLFSRALVLDGGGSPTTIAVLVTDQLIVTYRLRLYPTLTDLSSSVTLSAVSYSYTARVSSVGTATGNTLQSSSTVLPSFFDIATRGTGATIGAVTGTPSGGTAGSGTATFTPAAYTPGSYFRDTTVSVSPANHNPPGGIVTMRLQTLLNQAWQWEFATPIPKDNTKTLTFGVRLTWARI